MAERFTDPSKPIGRMKVFGSIYYMAPEVVRLSEYDIKVDTWSLGVLMVDLFYHDGKLDAWNEYVTLYLQGYSGRKPVTFQRILYRYWNIELYKKATQEEENLFNFIKKLLIFAPGARPTVTDMCRDEFFVEMYLPWVEKTSDDFARRYNMLKRALRRRQVVIQDTKKVKCRYQMSSMIMNETWQEAAWRHLTFLYPV